MKKIGVLLLLLLSFSGCSKTAGEIERGMALRSKILQATSCSFDADITADYGDKIYTFSMSCQGNNQGDITFKVTAPESISGITGIISENDGFLTFENVSLAFERMADDQITPVSAPWILLQTLRSGYLTSAGIEEEGIRLTIDDSYEEDALQLDIWLDENDYPKRGEILYDGRRILSLDVRNFRIM